MFLKVQKNIRIVYVLPQKKVSGLLGNKKGEVIVLRGITWHNTYFWFLIKFRWFVLPCKMFRVG